MYEDERKQVQDRKNIVYLCAHCVCWGRKKESEQGWPLSSIVAEQNVLGKDECSRRAEKKADGVYAIDERKSRPS